LHRKKSPNHAISHQQLMAWQTSPAINNFFRYFFGITFICSKFNPGSSALVFLLFYLVAAGIGYTCMVFMINRLTC